MASRSLLLRFEAQVVILSSRLIHSLSTFCNVFVIGGDHDRNGNTGKICITGRQSLYDPATARVFPTMEALLMSIKEVCRL